MKKKFFLAGTIAILGLGSFLVSCEKNENEFMGCTCTGIDDGEFFYEILTPAQMLGEFGVTGTDCNQFERILMAEIDNINCSEL